MHRRQRRRHIKNNPRSHPYAAIAGLWSLRILVDLDGWTGLPIHELASDGGLLRTIGLESFEDEEPNRKMLLQKLNERQAQVEAEAEKPMLDGVLGENLEKFGAQALRFQDPIRFSRSRAGLAAVPPGHRRPRDVPARPAFQEKPAGPDRELDAGRLRRGGASEPAVRRPAVAESAAKVLLEGLTRESIFKSGQKSRGIGFTAAIGKTG
jgi:hypothetical protein